MQVFRLNRHEARAQFDTLVLDRAEVLARRRDTHRRRLRYVHEQVVRILNIGVETQVEAAFEHREVNTHVAAQRAFPAQVGVTDRLGDRADALAVVQTRRVIVGRDGLVGLERDVTQITHTRAEFEQRHAATLHEVLVVQVPTRTGTPERSEARVLTELRRTFVAVDQVEEVLIVPHRVGIHEEAHVVVDIVLTARLARGILGCKSGVREVGRVVAHRLIRGVVAVVALNRRTARHRGVELFEEVAVVRQHQLARVAREFAVVLRQLAALCQVALGELRVREGRNEDIAFVQLLGEREVTVEAQILHQPHLQARRVEQTEVVAFVEVACLCFVEGVVDVARQAAAERTVGFVGRLIGVHARVVREVAVGRLRGVHQREGGVIIDGEHTRLIIGEFEEEREAVAL